MYQCPVCTLPIKNSRELYYHLRASHYGQTSPCDTDINAAKSRKQNAKSIHKCTICTEEFSLLRSMEKETETTQTIQEPIPGPSGAQMRITNKGRLRMPDKRELEQDQKEKEKQVYDKKSPASNSYELVEISRRYNQRLGADNISYRLKVQENPLDRKVSDILGEVYSMFTNLITDLRNDLENGDLVQFYLNHPILNVPIIVSARPIEDLTVENIMTDVEKVLQSEEELKLDEQFEIHVGILRIPRGGRGKYFINRQENIYRKRSIVEMINKDDNLCFDRAVAVCLAKLKSLNSEDNNKKQKWKKIIHKKSSYQFEKALKLMKISRATRESHGQFT